MNQATSHLGIELGSLTSVIAKYQNGTTEIILSSSSQREVPNVVGYKDNERFIGENGALQAKSNFKNTVVYFNRFIATQNCPFQQEQDALHSVCQTRVFDGKLHFEVEYDGEVHHLTPQQVTAAFLASLTKNLQHPTYMSYPDYFTEQDTYVLKHACEIAQIDLQGLVSESEAIMYEYGFRRREEQRIVCFVDIGASKTNIFVAQFRQNGATKLFEVHDQNLGGRTIDHLIYERFIEQLGLDKSKKTKIRMMEVIAKLRTQLSASQEIMVNLDNFDLDDIKVNRETFQDYIKPFLQQFSCLLDTVQANMMHFNIHYLHSIELLGGITRIPTIQQLIQEHFKDTKVVRSLISTDVIASGCALKGVNSYPVENITPYEIHLGWIVDGRICQFWNVLSKEVQLSQVFPQNQQCVLYSKGEYVTVLKTVELATNDFESIEMTLFYEPRVPGHLSAISILLIYPLEQFTIMAPEDTTFKFDRVKIVFQIDGFARVVINSAEVVNSQTLQQMKLGHYDQYLEGFTPQQIQDSQEKELKMQRQDSSIRQVQLLQYELEKFIQKQRQQVDKMSVLDWKEKEKLQNQLSDIENDLIAAKSTKEEQIMEFRQRVEDLMQPHIRLQSRANIAK